MVNFHDPAVILSEAVALDHFAHILIGIFLWEFLTTIDFEWNYVTSKKKITWPLLLYSACRICALGGVICGFIGTDVAREIDCQQWNIWTFTLAGISVLCASTLITIRVVAIWSFNRIVMAVAIVMSMINIGFLVYGISVGRSVWSNLASKCILDNTSKTRYNITVTAVIDVAQLVVMMVGLLRSRQEKRGFLRYLYIQGWLWLLLATIAQSPSAIFVNLNFNDPWNFMFQAFSYYTTIICATRMHRALIVYDMDVHKSSHGSKLVSSLRFRVGTRKGTAIGTLIGTGIAAPPTDHFDTTLKGSEISLAKKVAPLGDEEAQSHEVPSILAPENL